MTTEFELAADLVAHEPPEARGLARDEVRLMVSRVSDDAITHTRFRELPAFLRPGDVLVVNSSATINAAFDAVRETPGGFREDVALHFSTRVTENRWVIELRRHMQPLRDAAPGDRVLLPPGGRVTLQRPYNGSARLWHAQLELPLPLFEFATKYGRPIRYDYVTRQWPLSSYQSVFAREPGSAEMPSAARPFTRDLVARLERNGVRIVPVVLHTGVSSLDDDERPYPERFRVPAHTARVITDAKANGSRVIAVGTTVVRAVETAATHKGVVRPQEGWTDLVITPERGVRIVDALLTGFHAPRASHLWMLEALAGSAHIARCYESAASEHYLWHEFGDTHLILNDVEFGGNHSTG